jgi:hypothetical protein
MLLKKNTLSVLLFVSFIINSSYASYLQCSYTNPYNGKEDYKVALTATLESDSESGITKLSNLKISDSNILDISKSVKSDLSKQTFADTIYTTDDIRVSSYNLYNGIVLNLSEGKQVEPNWNNNASLEIMSYYLKQKMIYLSGTLKLALHCQTYHYQ